MHTETLQNNELKIEICPELGCKILSIFSKSTREEWLWKNPYMDIRKPIYGESFVENLDTGGWDEVIPSVSPCRISLASKFLDIPDHGDVVSLEADQVDADGSFCKSVHRLQSCSLLFERRLELIGSRILLNYTLENDGDISMPYIWAMHPLFQIEPGLKLSFETPIEFSVAGSFGEIEGNPSSFFSGAKESEATDQIVLPDSNGFARKLFSKKGQSNGVTLSKASGSELKMSWNSSEVEYLGIWMNVGGWSGSRQGAYFNLGIEPTNCPYDSLEEAITKSDAQYIKAGEKKYWNLQLEFN